VKNLLLLLDQKQNQELLRAELDPHYRVVCGASDDALDEDFDLCIMDGPALDRTRDRLQQRKEAAQPILLPVLLVTSRPDVKMITRHLWRSVDELIITPIEKAELRARVEILLRSRSLSMALRQRAEDAEHAARTRDEVLAMVSHDLRNPLNLVLTSAVMMLESGGTLQERERAQLQMIHRASDQMHRLIQDLLDLSSIESGRFSVQLESQPVAQLIREACDLLEHTADNRQIRLRTEMKESLPDVLADRHRVLQLLGNLIGNALKFTPAGGTVTVRARRDGDDVMLEVEDDGPGIDSPDLAHVFDRFWRGEQHSGEGAGLGLAIAHGIAASHGSELKVESQPGRGSTFSFALTTHPDP
jgi:signal transduction histidine kinase